MYINMQEFNFIWGLLKNLNLHGQNPFKNHCF